MRVSRIALWTMALLALGWWLGPLGPSNNQGVDLGPNAVNEPAQPEVEKRPDVPLRAPEVGLRQAASPKPSVILPSPPGATTEPTPDIAKDEGSTALVVQFVGWVQESAEVPALVELRDGYRLMRSESARLSETLRFEGLPFGTYQVAAHSMGRPRVAGFEVNVTLDAEQPERVLRLRLQPCATLRGTVVTRNGSALTEFQVRATYSSLPGTPEAPPLVDEYGVFEVFLGDSNPVEVRIDAPGHLPFDTTVDLVPGEVRWVQWTLEPRRPVGGIVRWPDGTPAADVSLFGRTDREGDQVSSDVDGRFTLDALSLRDLKLYARGGGESGQDFSNRWSFGQEEDLTRLDLWLQPSAVYQAKVTTDEGTNVAGQRLMLLAVDNRRVTRFGTTDDEGRATVSGLYPGTYTVILDRYEQALTEITVQPGEVLPEQLLRLPTDLSDKLRQAAAGPPRQW